MTLRAVYRDGAVVLPESADIPEGATLDVRLVRSGRVKKQSGSKSKANRPRTKRPAAKTKNSSLNDRLKSVIGKAKGLPADASRNIDHYLYGAARR